MPSVIGLNGFQQPGIGNHIDQENQKNIYAYHNERGIRCVLDEIIIPARKHMLPVSVPRIADDHQAVFGFSVRWDIRRYIPGSDARYRRPYIAAERCPAADLCAILPSMWRCQYRLPRRFHGLTGRLFRRTGHIPSLSPAGFGSLLRGRPRTAA